MRTRSRAGGEGGTLQLLRLDPGPRQPRSHNLILEEQAQTPLEFFSTVGIFAQERNTCHFTRIKLEIFCKESGWLTSRAESTWLV